MHGRARTESVQVLPRPSDRVVRRCGVSHQALDALTVGIQWKRVNWVLDADIRGFFDNMSHEWTMKFIEHRLADRRILRLIQKWLKAGVSEDGH
jgi:RNA-directed DNA polymerase